MCCPPTQLNRTKERRENFACSQPLPDTKKPPCRAVCLFHSLPLETWSGRTLLPISYALRPPASRPNHLSPPRFSPHPPRNFRDPPLTKNPGPQAPNPARKTRDLPQHNLPSSSNHFAVNPPTRWQIFALHGRSVRLILMPTLLVGREVASGSRRRRDARLNQGSAGDGPREPGPTPRTASSMRFRSPCGL